MKNMVIDDRLLFFGSLFKSLSATHLNLSSVMNGWMTRGFKSCSTVFKPCLDDGRKIMKRCVQ